MPSQRLYSVKTTPLPEIKAQIFLQDPLVAADEKHGVGLRELKLPGEAFLGAGPTTSRVAVVDYNADLDVLFEPASALSKGAGFAVGGGDKKKNFKFHQVNVWAVISHTLNHLETDRVFGRRIPWAFPGGRLLVLPHAGYWENAFYDRGSGALHFFYFEGDSGTIFTCLSHDIVAHELGHAVLDGLKPYYNEVDSAHAGGFHEYFGDAVAMVSALTMREVLVKVVSESPTRLTARNLISDIALEFGSALPGKGPLRSAANRLTMADLKGVQEEHDFSEVLSGAFYDVLSELYKAKVPKAKQDLGKTKMDRQVAVRALISAARQTSRMMLAALDYCPPAGLDYLDYARAVIRADEVGYPVDVSGYRRLVEKVLLKRKIIDSVAQLVPPHRLQNSDLRPYDIEQLASTPTDAYAFIDANREALAIPRDVNFDLSNLYRTRKVSAGRYYPPREIVIEFVWSEDVKLDGAEFGDLDGRYFPLYCGGTLVFDSDGNVMHYVVKKASDERKALLRKYVAYLVEHGAFGDSDGEMGIGRRGSAHRISMNVVGGGSWPAETRRCDTMGGGDEQGEDPGTHLQRRLR